MEEFRRLDYKLDHHKDLALIDQYAESGHSRQSMTIWNYWEPNPMPASIDLVKKHFQELDQITVAVHKTNPGQYLPMHTDLYTRYNALFNAEGKFQVVRAVVMLEHSAPGQILQVGDQTHGNWQAGQVFRWINQTAHAIYNFSMQDRYAVQITGLMK